MGVVGVGSPVCRCHVFVLGGGWVAGSERQWKMAHVEGASFDT